MKNKNTKTHWQIQIEGPSAGGDGSQLGTKRAELTLSTFMSGLHGSQYSQYEAQCSARREDS